MLPSNQQHSSPSSQLRRLDLLAGLSNEESALAAALGGARLPPPSLFSSLPQLGLPASALMTQRLGLRSVNSDLLAPILAQERLRRASRGLLPNPLYPLTGLSSLAFPPPAPRQILSSVPGLTAHETIIEEAYQCGKQAALASLATQRKTLDMGTGAELPNGAPYNAAAGRSSLQSLSSPFASLPSNDESIHHEAFYRENQASLSSLAEKQGGAPPTAPFDGAAVYKDPNTLALEALGSTGIERRKKNTPYFDASHLADPDPVIIAARRTRGGVTEPFPEKLHRMLQESKDLGEQDIISFFPHGRAFAIHHVERFCREVMPRYFKQSRLSSFQRQLNLYGFSRITSGPDAGGYYHELFLMGRPALAIHMRRVGAPNRNSSHAVRAVRQPNPTDTPDFYAMEPLQNPGKETS